MKVVWLYNRIGSETSLLYWGRILPKIAEHFPEAEFYCAIGPTRPIPGTGRNMESVGSLHVWLGPRKNSYDRQYVLPKPSMIRRLRRRKPAVIVLKELLGFAFYVALFRKLLSRSSVLVLIEGDPFSGHSRSPNPVVLAMRKWACRRFDLFMTASPSGRGYLTDHLGVPADRVIVHPFLVSHATPTGDAEPGELPAMLDADRDRMVFLCVAQLIPRKGVDHVIRALALLGQSARDRVALWVVGDGSSKDDLASLADELGVADTVRLLGRQPYEQMSVFYGAADVFLMPTLDDYRALVGFEALGQGLPLLHSKYDGACAEVVAEGQNGFAFDPTDHAALAERIRWFVDNRAALPAMSDKSKQLAARFTVDNAAAGLIDAIYRASELRGAKLR